MNGLSQAYRRLNIQPSSLSLEQAAGLISRIKYPEPNNYCARREAMIKKRTQYIIHLYKNHNMSGIYSALGDVSIIRNAVNRMSID
jgi:hypothetical protein